MNARVNAGLHFVSALYAGILIGFLWVSVPRSLVRPLEVHLLLGIALSFMTLDAVGGWRQWRIPPSGKTFSASLHLAFAAMVVAVLTFEFLQNRPLPFLTWMLKKDYEFLLLLGIIRLFAGGLLLD